VPLLSVRVPKADTEKRHRYFLDDARGRGFQLAGSAPRKLEKNLMFDTHVKPKIHRALIEAGVTNLPVSWEKSIYQQAAEASAKARKRRKT
jgi:hypothetical protein